MNSIWRTSVLLALAIQLAGHTPAIPPPRIEHPVFAEAVWQGRVTSTVDFGDYTEVLTGAVKYEYVSTNGVEDHYKITGGSVTWSATGQDANCVYSGGPTVYALSQSNTDGEMIVFSNGRYTIGGALTAYPAGIISVVCDPGGSFEAPGQNVIFAEAPLIAPYNYLSDAGTRMEGTYSLGFAEWTWNLTSVPPELEVEAVGYDAWRPEADWFETLPGNDLVIMAKVVNADGTPLDRPAEKFRYELTASSKEPGVVMNFPLPERVQNLFDLKFLENRNASAEKFGIDGQWVEMPSGVESQATLTSFDWGAFGTLKVTAAIDGIEVVGYLSGDKDTKEILIPKRSKTSKIADTWKSDEGVTELADMSDDDSLPAGDGHNGDGFTLYEEYRGFAEAGERVEGDPKKKDLFIHDEVGGRVAQGIALFKAATKVAVHGEVTQFEFPESRVMNINHLEGAHKVDQHGLLVKRGNAGEGYSIADGTGPGPPGTAKEIRIAIPIIDNPQSLVSIRTGGKRFQVHYTVEDVTHEIGHAVNIWHHGERDRTEDWKLKRDPTGAIVRDASNLPSVLADGAQITVYQEPSARLVPSWLRSDTVGTIFKLNIGVIGGQHSGDEKCFMGYNVAWAYAPSGGVRFMTAAAGQWPVFPPKNHFCTSAIGTGVNAPSRNPQPRYGNADNNASTGPKQRGNCVHRICLDDSRATH